MQLPEPITLALTEAGSPDVLRIPTAIVNAYAVGDPDGKWVLVDTGLPGFANYVQQLLDNYAAHPPTAIVLTHGHFDHAGNALALARRWNVPIYAHPDELPFLTGRSDYPPADPSMGGAIAQFSRAFPTAGYDFGGRVHALPEDGSVPDLPAWRWLATPGHSPGHVSLFRESDGFLIAGDALTTLDADSWASQVTAERELGRPPVPFTPDWDAAEESIRQLAELRPATIAAGHGMIMDNADLADRLQTFAARSHRPAYGRYATQPVRFDREQGVVDVPAPVSDRSLPWLVAGVAAVVGGVALVVVLGSRPTSRASTFE